MQALKRLMFAMAVVALVMPASPVHAADASPNASKVPHGWRELKFGMSEEAVKKAVQKLRGPNAKEWEKTPLTFFVLPDVAAGKLTKVDVDAGRIHHWMANDLTEGAATVRAYFDGGKLFAVHVLGTLDFDAFTRKATEAYGAEPRRVKLKLYDETGSNKGEPKELEVAFWRGNGVTAIVYQPSGWGPELLIATDDGLEALRKLHQRDPHGMGAGSNPASKAREDGTKF